MRIAAKSDIHGNLAALDAVVPDVRVRAVDQIVNLGDICSGTGPLADDPPFVAPAVAGVRALNEVLAGDQRFSIALLLTRDGLTLARRR